VADMWIRDLNGNKAFIDVADRDQWTVQQWKPGLPPSDGEFCWMWHPDVAVPALQPWASRAYFEAVGWVPGPPAAPVDVTRDPEVHAAALVGSVDDVLEWVGDDRERAESALTAELTRPKPRKSLVGQLEQVGQPEPDSSAAPAASNKE